MAMNRQAGVSALHIKDKQSDEYHWDFKIPPRSRIRENLVEVAGGTGFVFQDLQFKTGILANVDHEFMFAMYPNQVNVYLSLPCKTIKNKYSLGSPCKLELFSQETLQTTKELRFTRDDMSTAPTPQSMYASVWINSDDSWDDSIDMMRVTFQIEYQQVGQIISYVYSDLKRKLKSHLSPLELDASELFLSTELSDTVIVCQDVEYPVHKFLLTCKSPVFKRMFHHEMKEAKEGRIVIEDITPQILKEMLRFLYCGRLSNIKDICDELFIAADKYDLEVLKDQCELVLLKNITPDNALDMYVLADTYNGDALKEEAVRVLRNHKTKVVRDSETFQEFTHRYPELMFELYKTN